MTPTARTLQYLRDHGYIAGVVERTLPKCFIKVDLFGWCDIIAVPLNVGDVNMFDRIGDQWIARRPTVYVQTTTGAHHADRKAKILASEEARAVLAARNAIWIVTWRQAGGRKGGRWSARVESVTLKMFAEAA